MNVNFRMIIFWTTIVLCISQSTAWWWRSSDPPQDLPQYLPQAFYYQQRLLKTHPHPGPGVPYPPPGSSDAMGPPVPAIPLQVPLQAQLTPVPNIHNVQLVPCLCPVQPQDFEKTLEQPYNSKKEV